MLNIRFGDLQFLNVYPLHFGLEDRLSTFSSDYRIIRKQGTPRELNQAMLAYDLDISLVSSAVYLDHIDRFIPLGPLIGSYGPVRSVLLFSSKKEREIRTIALPGESATSIELLRILWQQPGCLAPEASLPQADARLLIGDRALFLAAQEEPLWDLASQWQSEQALPFVFGLWVAERKWQQRYPEAFSAMQDLLITAFQVGLLHMASWLPDVANQFNLSSDVLNEYFQKNLVYFPNADLMAGLRRFQELRKAVHRATSFG